jgi:hypothetical protein
LYRLGSRERWLGHGESTQIGQKNSRPEPGAGWMEK